MRDIIKNKIITILTNGQFPKNTDQVVYLFVLLNKFVKSDSEFKKLDYQQSRNTLTFYRNWLVHDELSFAVTKKIIDEIVNEYDLVNSFGATKSGSSLITFTRLYSAFDNLFAILNINYSISFQKRLLKVASLIIDEIIDSKLVNPTTGDIFYFSNKKEKSVEYIFVHNGYSLHGELIYKDLYAHQN